MVLVLYTHYLLLGGIGRSCSASRIPAWCVRLVINRAAATKVSYTLRFIVDYLQNLPWTIRREADCVRDAPR